MLSLLPGGSLPLRGRVLSWTKPEAARWPRSQPYCLDSLFPVVPGPTWANAGDTVPCVHVYPSPSDAESHFLSPAFEG